MQFTKIILNTYLENLWKKRRCEERKSENEVFGLDFSDSMQGFFFFLLFLDSLSSQKKTWLGQKIGTKNLKWSALYKIHMFSVFVLPKNFWTANFPVAISRDFFLPFLLPKFSVAQPSPLHTQKTAVRVRRKKWTALCFSQLFSAEVYTRASRTENIHKHMKYTHYVLRAI